MLYDCSYCSTRLARSPAVTMRHLLLQPALGSIRKKQPCPAPAVLSPLTSCRLDEQPSRRRPTFKSTTCHAILLRLFLHCRVAVRSDASRYCHTITSKTASHMLFSFIPFYSFFRALYWLLSVLIPRRRSSPPPPQLLPLISSTPPPLSDATMVLPLRWWEKARLPWD